MTVIAEGLFRLEQPCFLAGTLKFDKALQQFQHPPGPPSPETSVLSRMLGGYDTVKIEVNIPGAKVYSRPGYWFEHGVNSDH